MICPGYVQTNLGSNAIQSDKHSESEKKGLKSEEFAKICTEAIFEKKQEVVISDDFTHKLAVCLRNVFPETLFKILSKRAKN